MNEVKALSYIGLAAKSGSIASGEFMVEKALKERKAKLVILASDASDNTKKHFKDMCLYRGVPYYVFGDKDRLGHAIGRQMRASLAILDHGLAYVTEQQLI